MRYILTFIIHLVFGQDPKYMAASQNARSGSTPKTHRRSRPPIQTCDPDRSRPHDPDRSRPHDPDPFVLCWLDIFFFKVLKSITVYYKVLLQYYKVLLQYYKVTLCTTKYDAGWSREFWKIWPSRSRPRSRLFQTRSRPVPWNPRAVSIHSHVAQEEKTGLCVQCRIIWFSLSPIWNDYHDSRHSVPDVRKRHFTKVVVPRRPDHRGTIQTRLSTHAHMNIYIYTFIFEIYIYMYTYIHLCFLLIRY